jgi:GT2 family glycosyltransferase
MEELTISLVLFNANKEELKKLLASLERQQEIRFKLLIHDNSAGPTPIGHYNFEIEYHKSLRNIGFGRAHNANFKKSNKATHFLIINPDVYFGDPLLLRKLLDRSGPKTLSSVRILNPDGSIQEVHRLLPRFADIARRFFYNKLGVYSPYKYTYTLSHVDKTKDFECPCISGCFMLFAPGLFQEAGGFDEELFLYFEDVDLSRRCYYISGGKNIVHGDLVIFHTWGRQGYKNIEMFKVHVLSAVYYFNKYGIFRDDYSKTVNMRLEAQKSK